MGNGEGQSGCYLILFAAAVVGICNCADVPATLTSTSSRAAGWSDVTSPSALVAAEVVGDNETDVSLLMFCTAATATKARSLWPRVC